FLLVKRWFDPDQDQRFAAFFFAAGGLGFFTAAFFFFFFADAGGLGADFTAGGSTSRRVPPSAALADSSASERIFTASTLKRFASSFNFVAGSSQANSLSSCETAVSSTRRVNSSSPIF